MEFEGRLRRLEGLLRVSIFFSVVAVIFVALTLFRLSSLEVIRAQRLEVIDGSGRALMVLGRNPFGQPVISVYDINGNQRFGVSLDADGSAMVAIFDEKGNIVEKMGK